LAKYRKRSFHISELKKIYERARSAKERSSVKKKTDSQAVAKYLSEGKYNIKIAMSQ
jgi:hypothetical protein